MLEIDKTLISDDVLESKFLCDTQICKGACCIEGDAGAPLEQDEVDILKKVYPIVKDYLPEKGKQAIEEQGTSVKDVDGDLVTPLVNGRECAFTVFEQDGTASCGIEKAYLDGKIDFHKPISCHLYPIRLSTVGEYTALNYHRWHICLAACRLGKKETLALLDFAKPALIRKFGQAWWEQLEFYRKTYS